MARRSAGVPLPTLVIVSPGGDIVHQKYAENIGNDTVVLENGSAYLRMAKQRKGWSTLAELYAKDPNEELRANGMQWYNDFRAAARERRAPVDLEKLPDGRVRRTIRPFPEDLLPAEVMKRRAGASDVSVDEWEAPSLKPKRGRPAKAADAG